MKEKKYKAYSVRIITDTMVGEYLFNPSNRWDLGVEINLTTGDIIREGHTIGRIPADEIKSFLFHA